MTVNAALVRLVFRPFPLQDGDSDLTLLIVQAQERLAADDQGLAPNLRERCHALLVAHMWQMGDPELALKSFSSGDFSGSRDPGMTAQLLEYLDLVSTSQTADDAMLASGVGTRSDAVMSDLQLDGQRVPRYR
jgi:hypothetical protein